MFENISKNGIYKNLFNGKWIEAKNKSTIEISSPVDGKFVGKIQALSKEEVDEIFENSKEAQKSWAETPVNERAKILHKAADLLEENADEIAKIMSEEISKDKESSLSEVVRTADFIRFTADEGMHLEGETIGSDSFPGFKKNKVSLVTRVPLGVVLAISPFNYPVNLSASKIAPALIAGNSVILKPPTNGAISALHLAEVFNAAGLPSGVLNTITGRGSEIGDYLVTHKLVNFINFTGSTAVGRHIAKISEMVPMLMELGGKDAAIVLPDANLEEAAKNIVSGAYSYSGQRCTAVKRVLAVNSIADKLTELIADNVKKLKVGNPEDGAKVTPLINDKAADFVQELIDDAIEKGAKLILGNKKEKNLMYPTLFDNVTTDMRLAWEEPFGPVLPIIRVNNIDEAIKIANESEYGLQASIFTRNMDDAFYIAGKLEVGTVQINNKPERGPDHFPFQGVKSSGIGSQGIRYSIEAMSRRKAIVLNIK
ncbi:NADP-dependent glyceraldehyde-3-phosphate dehydrogenase [Clostridium guangxiense]|uniref:NADP-dependent glyceraldehyde-3-phosphate dehydrogenase n=1 Tax=Clostridium guangxiense TaxID=1662055 RepID=UPI001E5824D5|nr:NADP-dependent glyceraldehyde-3-phosphate dehydrogenase [Clostridium guangxiense]MCD2346904.1 NADP-dependent glyceraldehyde-3-phosphate dehydrogenase [Clostridium guangxiense]